MHDSSADDDAATFLLLKMEYIKSYLPSGGQLHE